MSKTDAYRELVARRKACRICAASGLTNPSEVEGGRFDSEHIGPWSDLQGNLEARLLVVGQDWGDVSYFIDTHGKGTADNPTRRHLIALLSSIGVDIPCERPWATEPVIFLANAILCLKQGGKGAEVRREWFSNCASEFLRPVVDLVAPRVVVTLGRRATDAVLGAYGLRERMSFREAVDAADGIRLSGTTLLFPRYHCGNRIMNSHRRCYQQVADWARLKDVLAG